MIKPFSNTNWKISVCNNIDTLYAAPNDYSHDTKQMAKEWKKGINNVVIDKEYGILNKLSIKYKLQQTDTFYLIHGYIMGYDIERWNDTRVFFKKNGIIEGYSIDSDAKIAPKLIKLKEANEQLHTYLSLKKNNCDFNFFSISYFNGKLQFLKNEVFADIPSI